MIESSQNPVFKKVSSLAASKGIRKEGLFLLSGEKLVREFLKSPNLEIVYEIKTPKHAAISNSHVIDFSKELFDKIDVLGTHFNILVLKLPEIPSLDEVSGYAPKGLEVLSPLGDPGNLGALIRSCEAFGVSRLLLTEEAANPFLPKSVKASAGSVLRLPIVNVPALSSFAENSGIFALDMAGKPIEQCDFPKNLLLVLGEEGPGIGHGGFANKISIPTANVESLNAVVAGSIALFCIFRGNPR
ncbi:MAG: RNA methyltransferase [Alphaproteobacteria bacterium]|nr:RNA methyltransferase [Alphaproteobacteria bacterium]MCL2505976.1 RNA methyltransferase [Alphaproteobacteria bacterium]